MEDGSLLIHNGDIFSSMDLRKLVETHEASGDEVTLALRSEGPAKHIAADGSGKVTDISGMLGRAEGTKLFSGITASAASSCGEYRLARRYRLSPFSWTWPRRASWAPSLWMKGCGWISAMSRAILRRTGSLPSRSQCTRKQRSVRGGHRRQRDRQRGEHRSGSAGDRFGGLAGGVRFRGCERRSRNLTS